MISKGTGPTQRIGERIFVKNVTIYYKFNLEPWATAKAFNTIPAVECFDFRSRDSKNDYISTEWSIGFH